MKSNGTNRAQKVAYSMLARAIHKTYNKPGTPKKKPSAPQKAMQRGGYIRRNKIPTRFIGKLHPEHQFIKSYNNQRQCEKALK